MAEAAISVAVEMITKPVVDSITTQLNYIRNYKINLATLQTQLLNLQYRRDVKQSEIDQAERNGDEIFELAQNWLDRANKTMTEAQELIEHNNRLNMQCFKNMCPNLKKRYVESKKVAMMMEAVSKLYDEGAFDTVSYPTLPAETWLPDGYENIPSRQSTLDGILGALRDDDVNMVGVYGLGGSGKTTMVKEVAKKAEEGKLFDKVVFVEVTDKVEVGKIQKVIAERLGSKFREESESVIADRLRTRIKEENKILLILDDIWKYLDLGVVGIPFGKDHMGCKLLFTSRDVNVLNEMESKTNFPIAILQKEEACNLFMKITGVGEEQHALRELAIKVAEECGGLLVAIITIAKALRNKPDNEWRIALQELRNPPSIENVEDSVVIKAYTSIRLSYKQLKSEKLKSIFLLCSIMGSSHDVSVEELSRYAVGLSLFTENAMDDVRDRVKSSVRKLKDASLLLGTPNGETFSVHDVVHDVGRWIAFNQQKYTVINDVVPRSWAAENGLENCTSITLHDIVELPKTLKCPQLKFFYMKTKLRFTKVPDEFFEGMLNLEVLHLIEIDLSIVPRSLCLLKHLRTLNLDECCVGDIAEIKDMEKLEILVIGGVNKIKQLSEEISQLTSLRLLDLRESSFIIPPKTISRLTQLEELYMDDWYGQQEVKELDIETSVASLEELKDLCHLTALHIRVADAEVLPESMAFEKLKSYKIVIGDGEKWNIRGTLRILQVTSDTNLCSEDRVIKQLKGIEDLLLDGEQRITNVLCELDGEGFSTLKHFRIKNNPFIMCVVDSMLSATCVAFPLLETLSLSNLVRLGKICHDQVKTQCFCQLRTIKVEKCHELKHLFSFSIAKHLSILEKLEVVDCCNIEEIFVVDRADDGATDPVFFEQLHSLTLKQLPRLRRICSEMEMGSTSQKISPPMTTNASSSEIVLVDQLDALPLLGEKVVFPNLKNLSLHDINLKRIWPNELQSLSCWVQNFKLQQLYIHNCCNLKYVFSSSILGSFNHLQNLTIHSCKDLEELIRMDDRCSNYVEFPSLETLRIWSCPKLREFIFNDKVSYSSLQDIDFQRMANLRKIWQSQVIQSVQYCPKLCKVKVWDCKNLEVLFPASIARSLVKLEELIVYECGIKEIVAKGGVEEATARFSFPQLTSLHLRFLKKLGCFYPGKHTTEWPKLKELTVCSCEKIDLISFQKQDVEERLDDDHTVLQQPLFFVDKAFFHLEKVKMRANQIIRCQSWFSESFFPKLKSLRVEDDESIGLPHSISEKFHNLEELELLSGNHSCEEVEKHVGMFASLKRLHLSNLKKLKQISKQESKMDLIFQKLERFEVSWCGNLINVMPPSAAFKNLKILRVWGCDRLISLVPALTRRSLMVLEEMSIEFCEEMTEIIANKGDAMEEGTITLSKLKSLQLSGLPNLTSFYSGNYTFNFPLLETLTVDDCPKLMIFTSRDVRSPNLQKIWLDWKLYKCQDPDLNAAFKQINYKKAFSILKKSVVSEGRLRLVWNLFPEQTKVFSNAKQLNLSGDDIEMMWQSQFSEHNFPKLKCLHVTKDKSKVFPFGIFQRFHDVEELNLRMSSYEEIFSYEEVEKYALFRAQIKRLRLYSLDDVKQMWKMDSKLNLLPNLEGLEVEGCSSLTNILLSSSSFENLKIMKVNNCEKLIGLMIASTTKSLVQLEEMQIRQCRMMTQVVTNGGDIVEDKITFHKLKKLELNDLSSLISFGFGNYTLEIPLLEILTMKECPNMKIFVLGNLSTPMLQEVWQDETKYSCKDDLNKIVRQHHEEMIFSRKKVDFENIRMMQQNIPEHHKVFFNLEQLRFTRDEISMLWQSQSSQQLFPKLKLVEVFEDESIVFPLAILERFHSVENLKLNCSSYAEIFSREDFEKYVEAFARIKWLTLYGLDNLKQMWKQDSSLNLILQNNIGRLQVEWCGSLVTLMPPSSSFRNLTWLSVEGCDGLMNLLAPATAKSLVQLKHMCIRKCKTMTEVISSNEEATTIGEIVFSKLRKLELYDLSSLTSFSPRNCTFTFPLLWIFNLKKCPKMKFFSSGVLNAPDLNRICYNDTDYYCDDDELNATIERIHEKLNTKTSSEDCAGPSTISSSTI